MDSEETIDTVGAVNPMARGDASLADDAAKWAKVVEFAGVKAQ